MFHIRFTAKEEGGDVTSTPSAAMFGTGEGKDYYCRHSETLSVLVTEEVHLFRAVSEAEYESVVTNGNRFVYYEWALEKKWFATTLDHAISWAKWFYSDGNYRIIEATVLTVSLIYMFYVRMLDNIGPAYAADVELLNKIVRRLRFL